MSRDRDHHREREIRSTPSHHQSATPALVGQGPKQRSFISFGFNNNHQNAPSSSVTSSPSRPSVNVNVEGISPAQGADTPEIRKYKKR